MTFTVEEISLLLEVNHSTRKATMQALLSLLKISEDVELRSPFRQLGGKLNAMIDKEFQASGIDSWKEDFDALDE